jgi:hypothetical protein
MEMSLGVYIINNYQQHLLNMTKNIIKDGVLWNVLMIMSCDMPLFSCLYPGYSNLKDYPGCNEHSDHDVTHCEKLLKKIYETVRNSPILE